MVHTSTYDTPRGPDTPPALLYRRHSPRIVCTHTHSAAVRPIQVQTRSSRIFFPSPLAAEKDRQIRGIAARHYWLPGKGGRRLIAWVDAYNLLAWQWRLRQLLDRVDDRWKEGREPGVRMQGGETASMRTNDSTFGGGQLGERGFLFFCRRWQEWAAGDGGIRSRRHAGLRQRTWDRLID